MRETSFIKQNKEKWKEFERILEKDKDIDPEKLNSLYVQITDDLSYSRTFYPYRSVRVYLNHLAQQVFNNIYKIKRSPFKRIKSFWTDELPQLVYEAKPEFSLALFVFGLAVAIGVLSSSMDPDFPRVILGDEYVDMTIENINSGDPMAVYKQKGELSMSLGITANNLKVAFLTFVMGIFFAIGSIAIMIYNGVMVGAFQYFFVQKGVFWESFLTIWTHGTLEISAIIIAGAAGLTMGKGLVFPGTLSRLQAFQISARRGLKIMMGIVPIFIIAGFIEGFMTRYTEMPDIISLIFILSCLAFVLYYFVYYPKKLAKKGFVAPVKDSRLNPNRIQIIQHEKIKEPGQIFSEVFFIYKKNLSWIIISSISAGILFCLGVFLFANSSPTELFEYPFKPTGALESTRQFFIHDEIPFLPILNTLIYSIVTFILMTLFMKETEDYQPVVVNKKSYPLLNFVNTLFVVLILVSFITYVPFYLSFLLSPIVFSVALLCLFVIYKENLNIFSALSRSFNLSSGSISQIHILFIILIFTGLVSFLILDSTLIWFYLELIGWIASTDQNTLDEILAIALTFLFVTTIAMFVPLLVFGICLQYSNFIEIKDAYSLRDKISQIGISKRIQGMERELY